MIDEHLDATAWSRRVAQLIDLGSGTATEKRTLTGMEKPGPQSVPTCEGTGEGGIDTRKDDLPGGAGPDARAERRLGHPQREGLLAAQQSVLAGGESGDRVTRRPAGSGAAGHGAEFWLRRARRRSDPVDNRDRP